MFLSVFPSMSPTQPAPAVSSRDPRRILTSAPTLLFGFFACVYALTSEGQLDSADGRLVALTARALLQHQTLGLPRTTPDAVAGVGGQSYSIYGIAQSLIEVPFVAAGLLLRHLTHRDAMVDWTVALTNAFVTALGCVVFFLVVQRLGASVRRTLALTLLYGLCTLAWPYAKTDFNEPLQSLSLLAATYAALRAQDSEQTRWLWAAGGALGLAVLTKSALVVAVPAFALYVGSATLIGTDARGIVRLLSKGFWWLRLLQGEARLLAPVALAGVATLWLNAVRFGSLFDNGYVRAVNGASLIGPLPWGVVAGAFGLLFSFNSGLIFYATPVVLGLVGLRRFARRQPRELLLLAVLALSLLAIYSTYRYWAGLAAFGPRYLVPLIPFLLLPAVDAFPGLGSHPQARPGAIALVAVVALAGLLEQVLGVFVSFGAYSALTCLQIPCPASLDASQSELFYDIWLLPTSLAYNFLGHLPHVSLSTYPFGTPPVGRPNWQPSLVDGMRLFWFVFLPHSLAALAAGLVLLGGLALACLSRLVRAAVPAPTSPSAASRIADAPGSGAGPAQVRARTSRPSE